MAVTTLEDVEVTGTLTVVSERGKRLVLGTLPGAAHPPSDTKPGEDGFGMLVEDGRGRSVIVGKGRDGFGIDGEDKTGGKFSLATHGSEGVGVGFYAGGTLLAELGVQYADDADDDPVAWFNMTSAEGENTYKLSGEDTCPDPKVKPEPPRPAHNPALRRGYGANGPGADVLTAAEAIAHLGVAVAFGAVGAALRTATRR